MDPRNRRRRIRRGLLGLCLGMLVALPAQAATPLRISFIPSQQTPLYQGVIAAAREALQDAEVKPVTRVIDVASWRHDAASIEAGSDLLVPIGIHATEAVLRLSRSTDILATLVPRASLRAEAMPATRRFGAVLLDQPLARQLLLVKVLLGPNQRIGSLLGPVSQSQASALQHVAQRLGLPLVAAEVADEQALMPALNRLLGRSDVLLALPDPLVFNRRNLRNILLSTYRQRIPVLGFSRATVRAGALAAVYSTPQQIGRQTGHILAELQRRPHGPLPAAAPPREFEVAINGQVARSFGLGGIDGPRLARKIRAREAQLSVAEVRP